MDDSGKKVSRRRFIEATALTASLTALANCEKTQRPTKKALPKPSLSPTPKPTQAAQATPTPPTATPAATPQPVPAATTQTATVAEVPEPSAAQMDPRPFKLGIIGCGDQATLNLMPAALKVPGVTFTAVCDVIPARAQKAAQIAGGKAKIYDDYKVLLKEADIDGVIIATPLAFHKDMVIAAFQNGRDVFCVFGTDHCCRDNLVNACVAAVCSPVQGIGEYFPLYEMRQFI